MNRAKILVSACLLGERVRYDGAVISCPNPVLGKWIDEGRVVPVCPEVSGGLPVPRPPAEIQGGDGGDVVAGTAAVINIAGEDVSEAYLSGAKEALRLAEEHKVVCAILKARSPSCGNRQIYDGHFSERLIDGQGVAAALLAANGFQVFNEEEIDQAADWIGA